MNHLYRLKTDILIDEKKQEHTVFGIAAFSTDGKMLGAVSDIFFDKIQAEHFVSLCNTMHLALIHLPEVAEDQLV